MPTKAEIPPQIRLGILKNNEKMSGISLIISSRAVPIKSVPCAFVFWELVCACLLPLLHFFGIMHNFALFWRNMRELCAFLRYSHGCFTSQRVPSGRGQDGMLAIRDLNIYTLIVYNEDSLVHSCRFEFEGHNPNLLSIRSLSSPMM